MPLRHPPSPVARKGATYNTGRCLRGHDMTASNTVRVGKAGIRCKTCRNAMKRRLAYDAARALGQEGSTPADGALGRRDRSVHAEPINPSETNHG